MNPCQLTTSITAFAIWLSEQLSNDQLSLLAASFTQLGDTLDTIAVQRQICCERQAAASQSISRSS